MKKASFILGAIVLFFLFSCEEPTTNNNNQGQADTIEYPTNDDIAVDTNEVNTDTDTTSVMVEDDKGNLTPKDEEVYVEDNTNHNYYVIVGSFKTYANAEKCNKIYTKKGYKPVILEKVGQYNRVSAAYFNEEGDARNELKALRKKFKNKTFWLLYK